MAAVVSGVVVLAGGVAAGLVSARARRENPCAAGVVRAADDGARDPLTRRLRQGYASVEIVVWLDDTDRLLVGGSARLHRSRRRAASAWSSDRWPIGSRPSAAGSMPTASRRFVSSSRSTNPIRSGATAPTNASNRSCAAHPDAFTRVVDGVVQPGPVTVLLTGRHMPRLALTGAAQRRYLRRRHVRRSRPVGRAADGRAAAE